MSDEANCPVDERSTHRDFPTRACGIESVWIHVRDCGTNSDEQCHQRKKQGLPSRQNIATLVGKRKLAFIVGTPTDTHAWLSKLKTLPKPSRNTWGRLMKDPRLSCRTRSPRLLCLWGAGQEGCNGAVKKSNSHCIAYRYASPTAGVSDAIWSKSSSSFRQSTSNSGLE